MPELNQRRAISYAWVSGVIGAICILLAGYLYGKWDVGQHGWRFGGVRLTSTSEQAYFWVLVFAGLAMYASELMIRWLSERGTILQIHPQLERRRFGRFVIEVVYHYLAIMLLLYAARLFYHHAAEYAFAAEKGKYSAWFMVFDQLIYLAWWFLPVYVALTRALQYSAVADTKEPAYMLIYALQKAIRILRIHNSEFGVQNFDWSQALLSVGVKMFFVPLMTIFFYDQFTSYTRNWGYVLHHLNTQAVDYTFQKGLVDFYNISFTVIFVLDVALAWAGYVFASRWIQNHIQSVEPTFIGWAVALLCYPPFNSFLHLYFSPPSDKDFLDIAHGNIALGLAILSLISYFIYMSSTIFFGLRFSNLTHRGIVETGWYRFVRHPAYAGKNISWWLVMLPVILYQAIQKWNYVPLLQILGLILMTWLYYYRAITEERHLSADPVYRAYMQRVKYRFVPGLF